MNWEMPLIEKAVNDPMNIGKYVETEIINKLLSDLGSDMHENSELTSEEIDRLISPIRTKWLS